jgi:hypothetical protein
MILMEAIEAKVFNGDGFFVFLGAMKSEENRRIYAIWQVSICNVDIAGCRGRFIVTCV